MSLIEFNLFKGIIKLPKIEFNKIYIVKYKDINNIQNIEEIKELIKNKKKKYIVCNFSFQKEKLRYSVSFLNIFKRKWCDDDILIFKKSLITKISDQNDYCYIYNTKGEQPIKNIIKNNNKIILYYSFFDSHTIDIKI